MKRFFRFAFETSRGQRPMRRSVRLREAFGQSRVPLHRTLAIELDVYASVGLTRYCNGHVDAVPGAANESRGRFC